MKIKVSRETSCQVSQKSQKQLQFCRMKMWKTCLKCGKLHFPSKVFLPHHSTILKILIKKKHCAVFLKFCYMIIHQGNKQHTMFHVKQFSTNVEFLWKNESFLSEPFIHFFMSL